jgi:HD-GYP domain-containing protein (c-di-GMP phosphodiesterase class II)
MSAGMGSAQTAGRGQNLALALAAAIRTAAYYEPDNIVMQQVCATLGSLLAEQSEEEGSVTIGVHSHCVFVGKTRVRTSVSTYGRFTYLVQLFETWGINTLTFAAGLTEDELMRVLLVFAHFRRTDSAELAGALRADGLDRVQVDAVTPGSQAQAIAPVEAYAAAMRISDEMSEAAGPREPGGVRRLRHVTQAVVDQILRDPRSLVALTTIKDFDRYLISHSTNVAVLSVVLGQRLGLSKSRLGELCLAAFLHDAGKLEVAPDILNKPGALDPEEWGEMRSHPVLAARTLLGDRHLTASSMRAVVVAFEHHLNYDLSGYPRTEVKDTVSLFGNIVAIADRYDALTTARVYRKNNFTPHEALVYVISNAGILFDPILVKLFVEIMGLYPPGTVVELTGGEVGIVCEPPAVGAPLDRPKVRVVTGGEPGTVLALDERVGGEFVRSVANVFNPANMGQLPAVDISLFGPAG